MRCCSQKRSAAATKKKGDLSIDPMPLRCHFTSRVMGRTQLFVGTFLRHPSTAAELVPVIQT